MKFKAVNGAVTLRVAFRGGPDGHMLTMSIMPAAIERIVVQATRQEKRAIVDKARRLGLPISELMRRGAAAYRSREYDAELRALADAATAAVERAGQSIDNALAFVAESEARIVKLEAAARRRRGGRR